MSWSQKIILKTLLAGGYLRKVTTHAGKEVYRVYTSAGIIEEQLKSRTVDRWQKRLPHSIFRKDRLGRYHLLRRKIQQLHGNCTIKKLYKQLLKTKS